MKIPAGKLKIGESITFDELVEFITPIVARLSDTKYIPVSGGIMESDGNYCFIHASGKITQITHEFANILMGK
jgi:hypothetical protein